MAAPALPRGLWRMILYDLECQDALHIWGTCAELSGTLGSCDIAASAFALTRLRLSATSPLALKHWVRVLHQCMETARVEDWAQSMLIHTEEYDDDADDVYDHSLVSWPASRQHSPRNVLDLMELVHGACPSLCLDSHILAMSCMVMIGPSCTSKCRIHMRVLCFAEGHRYQVWELMWSQHWWELLRTSQYDWWDLDCDESISRTSLRHIAVCNIDHPAYGIAVLPSISRRLDLWESFQLWHTTEDDNDVPWLPCFYDFANSVSLIIPSAVRITNFFHPHNAARQVHKQAQDGIVYTCAEFIHWYGTHLGRQRWLEAASGDEQRLNEILRRAFPEH
jgi:hypothetical protein